jgi:hypothetical protein
LFNDLVLVEQFRADVGQRRPGDQHRRDEGEHAEHGDDQDQVTAFHGIHKAALSFHNDLLSNCVVRFPLFLIKVLTLK